MDMDMDAQPLVSGSGWESRRAGKLGDAGSGYALKV
jgi:hypothetical protein